MAQAEKTGAKTGTKGTDVPDVPSARFTARNSTFRCSANRTLCASFRHEDPGISRNLKSETGGYKFQKSLKPEQTDEQTIHRRIFPLRRSGHWTGKMCEFRYGPLPSGRARASAPRRSPPAGNANGAGGWAVAKPDGT